MKVLLDTHAFLWWITDDPRLSERARDIIGDGGNDVFFSVASAWEIAIKAGIGRLHLPNPADEFVTGEVVRNGFSVLPIHLVHALRVHALPPHHRDPFDRLLVAQSGIDELPLISRDPVFARYDIDIRW